MQRLLSRLLRPLPCSRIQYMASIKGLIDSRPHRFQHKRILSLTWGHHLHLHQIILDIYGSHMQRLLSRLPWLLPCSRIQYMASIKGLIDSRPHRFQHKRILSLTLGHHLHLHRWLRWHRCLFLRALLLSSKSL